MATITGYNITRETTVDVDAGRQLGIAEGGQIRGRNTYEKPLYKLSVVIQTDVIGRDALFQFYTDFSELWNNITIDSVEYVWLFENMPKVTASSGDLRMVTFNAMGYTV